jgi:DNA (cytosine-5)-methyltransferase 1
MDLGFDQAGFTTLWQCEVDAKASSVLAKHWPDVKRYGDVRAVHGGKVAPVDVISFGSPCQDLSVAGARAGLTGSRSGLFHEAVRIIKQMRRATKNEYPRAVVWENVTGALSSSQGNDFAEVLDVLAKSGAVDISWRVLDAQHFGVPQRRRRVFLVAGYRRGVDFGEVLAVCEGGSGDLEAGSESGQDAAGSSEESTGADSGNVIFTRQVVNCVSAKWAKGTGGPAGDEDQNLVVMIERAGKPGGGKGPLLSYDKSLTLKTANTQVLFQPEPFVKRRRAASVEDYETWASAQELPAPTLNVADNTGDTRATVLTVHGKVAHTLTAEGHDASEDGTGRGTPVIAFDDYNQSVSSTHHTLRAGPQAAGSGAIEQKLVVRRLTPRECERLMGWPDDHTRWDEHGNELKDSPRYRACGNGVATPVARYVAERLAKVLST